MPPHHQPDDANDAIARIATDDRNRVAGDHAPPPHHEPDDANNAVARIAEDNRNRESFSSDDDKPSFVQDVVIATAAWPQ